MGRRDTNALLVLIVIIGAACSATRSVRPVGRGKLGTAISVGGPLFVNLGPPLPVPIAVVSARYGVSKKTDIDAGIVLPIVSTLGGDIGATTQVLSERGPIPTVMAGGRVSLVGPVIGGATAAPHVLLEAHSTASWSIAHGLLGYLGADVLFDAHSVRLHPTALMGINYAVPLGGLSFTAEGRWLAMATSSRDLSVRYGSFAGQGALGVVLAVAYTFDLAGPKRAH